MPFFGSVKKMIMKGQIALLLLLLTSCSWFNNDSSLPQFPTTISYTITGKLGTNGAMPQNFSQLMNSRTAIASAPDGQTIQYKVLLLDSTGVTEIAGASSQVTEDSTTHELSYMISFTGTSITPAEYKLRAVAYYMSGTTEVDILASPDTPLDAEIDLKGSVFTKDLELRPMTSGSGEVYLTISIENPSDISSINISEPGSTSHFTVEYTNGGSTAVIKHLGASVSCGSYPVTINFYYTNETNGSTSFVYQFKDVINVFKNLKTNVWVDNGNSPHLTTATSPSGSTTICKITSALLAEFRSTNFYVDTTATVSGSGTYFSPYNSLITAIQYINTNGNDNTYYTIHVRGNGETFTGGVAITKKIILEPYITVPGAKDGVFQISMTTGTAFIINSNGYLCFKSNGQAIGSSFPSGATKGIVISGANNGVQISYGKFEMEGGYISCANTGVMISAPATGTSCIFEMSGGYISGTINSSTLGGVRVMSGAIFRVWGKPVISGGNKGVYLESGQTIKVTGPLREGALIGVTTATTPTTASPSVQITTGYGYQAGGYNAGVQPGNYFRGDVYGVTLDNSTPSTGEAVLKLSGGSLSTKIKDDITIEIDHTNASRNAADRLFTFKVIKDKGAVAPATSTNITNAEGISYSYKLADHSDSVTNTSLVTYYTKSKNTLTLENNLPTGKYKLEVDVTWQGNEYSASFDISYVNVDVPSGSVAVAGAYWGGSSTLCNGDSDRQSNKFIAGRKLNIPNIIASDHEVTQTEWEQYMTYDPANTHEVAQSGADKDVYPVYYIDWYGILVYCNLRTLDDSTFGSTRAERLSHCVYSLNGTKDPDLWLESLISGSRFYKIGDKFYYKCYISEGSANGGNTVLSGFQFDLNADGWRLPTAAEWEYLARGGNLTSQNQTIYSGSDLVDEVHNSNFPYEIRTTKPNSLKIYDLSGNMPEWLWDKVDGVMNVETTTPITGAASGVKRWVAYSGHKINDFLSTYVNRGFGFDNYILGFRVIRTVIP